MQKLFWELAGLPTLRNEDIPHFRYVTNETVSLWTNSTKSWQVCDTRAHAVVVNSYEDLEACAIATLSKCCNVPIYDVGFWVESLNEESATSLWEEDKANNIFFGFFELGWWMTSTTPLRPKFSTVTLQPATSTARAPESVLSCSMLRLGGLELAARAAAKDTRGFKLCRNLDE
ncbi:hypothetical protein GOP47_0017785 [Adiantum capillus-veneris]|uniref:Uncharacterized protein n=1 Tax=Adiantum capillus-veneris TaxID=13818 RepID=A0A9D4UGH8_ADICA|nr:hypothetical protein GOP47_0017785 [Adiantum capillus-veneris]